jgi:hypothetical protein
VIGRLVHAAGPSSSAGFTAPFGSPRRWKPGSPIMCGRRKSCWRRDGIFGFMDKDLREVLAKVCDDLQNLHDQADAAINTASALYSAITPALRQLSSDLEQSFQKRYSELLDVASKKPTHGAVPELRRLLSHLPESTS